MIENKIGKNYRMLGLIAVWLSVLISGGCDKNAPITSPSDKNNPDIIHYVGLEEDFGGALDGLAWDGEFLWVTVESNSQGEYNCILKVNPTNGKIVQKWPSSSYGECGIAYHRGYLWTAGVHNPNGIVPPDKDPDNYDLIYQYSIDDNNLTLVEMYAPPSRKGHGNSLTFDRDGNLWIFAGKIIERLELLHGVEADYHPGLDNVWASQVVESHTVFDYEWGDWIVKGSAWVIWKDGRNDLIMGGYEASTVHTPDEKCGVFITDPLDNYTIRWSCTWPGGRRPDYYVQIGHFGMEWDRVKEVLWTQSGEICRHSRDSSDETYIEALFGKRDQ